MEAAAALGKATSPAGFTALTAALSDTSEVVRQAAHRSLQEAIKNRPTATVVPTSATAPASPAPVDPTMATNPTTAELA